MGKHRNRTSRPKNHKSTRNPLTKAVKKDFKSNGMPDPAEDPRSYACYLVMLYNSTHGQAWQDWAYKHWHDIDPAFHQLPRPPGGIFWKVTYRPPGVDVVWWYFVGRKL